MIVQNMIQILLSLKKAHDKSLFSRSINRLVESTSFLIYYLRSYIIYDRDLIYDGNLHALFYYFTLFIL